MCKDLLIIGGGPGGYTAAIRAAQLGLSVALVEEAKIGGTCLNVGCIPTKVFYKHAQVLETLGQAGEFGISLNDYAVDYDKMQQRKETIISQLVEGIDRLLKANGVEQIYGRASFLAGGKVKITDENGAVLEEQAKNIIIATGSKPALISMPGIDLEGVITSDDLLSLEKMPESMVIIGGGVIGIELAGVIAALGCKTTVLEYMPNILPGIDTEITKRLTVNLKRKGMQIESGFMVKAINKDGNGLKVSGSNKKGDHSYNADKVLIATGRTSNINNLNLDSSGVEYDRKGIKVNSRFQTSAPNIYAIGDAIGGMMLAHVAAEEGIAAVEAIKGLPCHLNYKAVPSCVFTFPEVSCVGLSEDEAKAKGINYISSKFMFGANGKALTMGEPYGFVKVIADGSSKQILGVHIMGPHASDLIHEAALAIANGLKALDIIENVHAHPTLAEAFCEAVMGLENRSIHMVNKTR